MSAPSTPLFPTREASFRDKLSHPITNTNTIDSSSASSNSVASTLIKIIDIVMATNIDQHSACLWVFRKYDYGEPYTGKLPEWYRRYDDDCVEVTSMAKDELRRFIEFLTRLIRAWKLPLKFLTSLSVFLDIKVSIGTDNLFHLCSTNLPTTIHIYLTPPFIVKCVRIQSHTLSSSVFVACAKGTRSSLTNPNNYQNFISSSPLSWKSSSESLLPYLESNLQRGVI